MADNAFNEMYRGCLIDAPPPPPGRLDYRKAVLSTEESRAAEQERKRKELEAKNTLNKLPLGKSRIPNNKSSWTNMLSDIRMIIWRILLRRQGTVLPGHRHYCSISTRKAGDHYYISEEHDHKLYRYQWNELHQKLDGHWSNGRWWSDYQPPYHCGGYGQEQTLTIAIPTAPTNNQSQLIAQGQKNLPLTFNPEFGVQTGCEVFRRGRDGDAGHQIINSIEVCLSRFEGIALLSVCKQLREECAQVLYGENTFAFITSNSRPLNPKYVHDVDEFTHYPSLVPGLQDKYGRPQSRNKTIEAIDSIFTPGAFRAKFVARDTMLDFFHRIGRFNTSFLKKIEIEGRMKNAWESEAEDGGIKYNSFWMGLPRILPILTTVLKHTCPHLRALTLHMEDRAYDFDEESNRRWDDDLANRARKTDEERIDKVVEKVVLGLDTLEVLQLGGHKAFKNLDGYAHWKFEDVWGTSTRWMTIVAKRAEDRAKEKAAREMEARVAKMTIGY